MLVLEEDKVKVVWSAADIEVWLKTGRKNSRKQEIVVDSYEVKPITFLLRDYEITALKMSLNWIGNYGLISKLAFKKHTTLNFGNNPIGNLSEVAF